MIPPIASHLFFSACSPAGTRNGNATASAHSYIDTLCLSLSVHPPPFPPLCSSRFSPLLGPSLSPLTCFLSSFPLDRSLARKSFCRNAGGQHHLRHKPTSSCPKTTSTTLSVTFPASVDDFGNWSYAGALRERLRHVRHYGPRKILQLAETLRIYLAI